MSEQRDLELNEWLHERLFGGHPVCRDVDCLGDPHWHGSRGAMYRIDIIPYSSMGEGMLAVLREMVERGYGFKIEPLKTGGVLKQGAIFFARHTQPGWTYHEELPEAVASAARAALEAESR